MHAVINGYSPEVRRYGYNSKLFKIVFGGGAGREKKEINFLPTPSMDRARTTKL